MREETGGRQFLHEDKISITRDHGFFRHDCHQIMLNRLILALRSQLMWKVGKYHLIKARDTERYLYFEIFGLDELQHQRTAR